MDRIWRLGDRLSTALKQACRDHLTCAFFEASKKFPAIPTYAQPAIFCIKQEARSINLLGLRHWSFRHLLTPAKRLFGESASWTNKRTITSQQHISALPIMRCILAHGVF